ncbi:LamG-like jellyroll fold domain-containing protein, partial [Dapis sp. BLCC M229]|uniref:LamG-like jellyroll fold domain-containing protein n=1 Tax=Dapis sp. BLCC M229 TaxID=3400188 RepID=UPI003CECB903
MSEVATKNITFWNTTGYNYPGFGQTVEVPDGLGGTIGITYNRIDYDDRGWRGKPDGDTPITPNRFLSGEIENKFSLTGKTKAITATMPLIRTVGNENNYSVTLDFSKYKASTANSQATDGATSGDTYLAISRFLNGNKAGYTTIKVTAKTLDGSELNLGDWKLFNSGTLGKSNNTRIFLDAGTQTISGKNSQGKQELCPTPANPSSAFGTHTALGLFELPSNQRYVSITLSFKQKKIQGVTPNDLHDIYVASNTSSTSPINEIPQTKPMDINNGLQLHLPLNEIVENAESEKEVVDVSAGKLNGKVNGATVVAEPRFGNCLNFNGNNDYVIINPMPNFPSEAMTVYCWIKSNNTVKAGTPFSYANSETDNAFILYDIKKLIVYIAAATKDTGIAFNDGEWHCVAVSWNSSNGQLKVYQDGEEKDAGILSQGKKIASGGALVLGQEQDAVAGGFDVNQAFEGQMTHVRMYNRVLSPEEIKECMKVDTTPPPMDINSGLQLHLPLNEIVENAAKEKEVVDISAGKLNGKVNGATVVAEPRFGNCLNFNGIDDCVIINPMPNFPSEAMTVLCWVRSNNQSKEGTVLSYAKSSAQKYNEFQIYNIKNITPTVNNKWHSTGVAFNDGEWHCVAITWQSSDGQFKVYKDGKEVHSKVISQGTPIATGGALVVGQEQDKLGGGFAVNQAFQGQMAHLRMYNRVLSPEDINECMEVDGTPPPMDINRGLQLHLPLNEIVENAAKEKEVVDISAAKLKGKVNGNPKILDDSRFGSCLNFDGVDDYIQMPEMNIDYSQGLTVEAWVHYNSFKSWSRIIDFGNGAPNDNILFANEATTSNLCFDSFKGTTSNRVKANGKLELSKWLHLAVTVDGSGNTKIYNNGTEVGSGSINLPNKINRTKNYIGKSNWPDELFYGKMSNLRLYNRALSPEEINECMKVDETPPPVDINRGLQLHLPLNEIVENAAKEKEVVDVSPAKLKGKVNGEPIVVADSKLGSCLNFDGVDDYIQIPEMNIDYSQGLTVEAWVHYSSFKSWSRIIDFGKGSGNNNILFANEGTTQNLVFDVYQGATRNRIKADGMLELNQWLYLTVTVDGSGSGKVYKNGEEVQSGLVHLPNNLNRTKNYIGDSNWSADGFFHGKISHLRMYNRALSKEEINECMAVDETPPPMDINRGLQLHLPLNEIVENAESEKEVVDISVAKLNGKVNGKPIVLADDRFGNCLNFDGNNDYIIINPMPNFPSETLTVLCWVKSNNTTKAGTPVSYANSETSNAFILFDIRKLIPEITAVTKQTEVVLNDGKWHCVALSWNSSDGQLKVYKDGEEKDSGTLSKGKKINSGGALILGQEQDKLAGGFDVNQAFEGQMAHLRIYDRVLSPEEINECMKVDGTPPPEPMDINRGLQLHLPLNEIVENSAKEKEVVDVSAGKLNGKVNGATVVADSKFGKCINFDGVDDYIQMPEMNIDYSQGFTIETWWYCSKLIRYARVINFGNGSAQDNIIFSHRTQSDVLLLVLLGSERKELVLKNILEENQWLHLAATVDQSGNAKVYKNGQEVGGGLIAIPNNLNRTQNYIGTHQPGASSIYFQGKMSNLRLYNRPLSPEEINECIKVDEDPEEINELMQVDEAETTEATSTTGEGDGTATTDATDTTSTTGEGDGTATTDATDTTSTTGEGDGTATTETTDTTSTTGEGDGTATTETTDTTSTTGEGETDTSSTTETTDTTSTTGEGDGTATTDATDTTSTTGEGDGTATTETT